ncbi:hypothetical protein [Streptomyces sp. NRRL B-3648]|uniref:hypothetical protein n=1 Tax=Streptomyces sp. NRRL B-3648 TaxID=1519493 RepID=UPI0006B016ED|nr:hypothetical protein [Streptomyces sp. NRRL B-3648]KOV95298.1 hypothetical protein ADL04_21480 [Streptomyces sp. NRRL B-3648]
MQKKSGLRGVHAGWYAGVAVLVLGLVAAVLYGSGAYDSWRDGRSLDQACDGTLARDGLAAALGSSDLRAEQDDGGTLAGCFVKASAGTGRAVRITLRWSTAEAPSGSAVWYESDYNGVRAQAAPLGDGWPGVVRYDGTWQIMVALDCARQQGKALVAYGDLYGASDGTALTGLGRVTTETARKAAGKYGCRVRAGKPLTRVSTARLGEPGTAKPLARAQGSCAALRNTPAAAGGTPGIMEYPADPDAPQTNCYLVTAAQKPGYGLYAYYGAAAKDYESAGYGGPDHDSVLATAACPGAGHEAVFAVYHLYDRDTDSYPVPHWSASFARSALKAFAGHEAERRGCGKVRIMDRP